MPKKVAVFDFDHTLIAGDSFWPFLCFAAGHAAACAALAAALSDYALRRAQGDTGESPRTFVKAFLLRRLIAGRSLADLSAAILRLRSWQTENAPVMQKLRDHSAQGDAVVIASGGLSLYLPDMLRGVPFDALICTDIGVENGVATGEMINGNCVRQRKAQRVGEWLAANGPFDESFGYGNYPHDLPMLDLVRHRIIV